MERTLSLVLDDEGKISLTLMKDEADKIDSFTTRKFENSDQIREFYQKKIADFLEKNRNYIEAVSNRSGRRFNGRIVILEARDSNNSLNFIEKRVLYKKHLVAFKELVKDKPTMEKFVELEKIGYNQYGFRRLVSPFVCREIKYSDFRVKSRVELIRREIKGSKTTFYDALRIIIKAYEIERKKRPYLKTIEAIYKKYLEEKENEKKIEYEIVNDNKPSQNKDYFVIDGLTYHIDDIPFDLDDLAKMETEYRPDGLGDINDPKTRWFLYLLRK